MGKNIIKAAVIVLGMLLIGCRHDDAFVGDDTGTTTGTQSAAASLTLLAGSPQVGSSDSSSVSITAIVKDGNNNLVSDIPVVFTASSGALAVTQSTTDAAGQALATLGPGGDFSVRTITVTAVAGKLSQNVAVAVTGTTLSVDGDSAVTLGNTASINITLKDSDGNPIANRAVLVTSALNNPLSAPTLTTNTSGQISLTVSATHSGTDTITASAEGVTANRTLTISSDQLQVTAPVSNASINIGDCAPVTINYQQNGAAATGKTINFSATRGILYSDANTCSVTATSAVTNGSGVATLYIKSTNAGPSTITAFVTNGPTASRAVSFVATTPATIDLQAFPATIGPNNGSQTQQQAAITAIVRDAANNLVANQVVRFSIVQDNSGGTLTTSTATTDSLGRASTAYISSAATTAQNGVVIRAEMGSNSAINKTVSLTVAQSPLFVRLGTGNLIIAQSQTVYDKKYTVIVTDASGNAAPGVHVSVSIAPLAYTKGTYVFGTATWDLAAFGGASGSPQSTANECPSEDLNQNGILDSGEDDVPPNGIGNGNGKLDPGNVASVPSSVTTGSDGTYEFDIIYPKQYANWVKVRLTATTSVAGTESSDSAVFWLPIASDDVSDQNTPPPGMPSPFGLVTADCHSTD